MESAHKFLSLPDVWGAMSRLTRWRIISSIDFLSREDRKRDFSRKFRQSLLDQIFKNSTWIDHAHEAYGAKLFLLGSDLSTVYYDADKISGRYLALFAYDISGDLRYDKDMFLKSLKPHKIVGFEIHFVSGLILNVHSIFISDETTSVDCKRLFQARGQRIRIMCLSCRDDGSGLVKIKRSQMIGLRDTGREWVDTPVLNPADPKFNCRMDLSAFGKDQYGQKLWCTLKYPKPGVSATAKLGRNPWEQ